MRRIYTFFLYLFTPFILLRLFWKSRALPAYRYRILERFSMGRRDFSPVDVWLHAVSLGEAVAASPLIEALLSKSWRVLVTTMTPTGSAYVMKRFERRVAHQYVPYDLPWAVRRFFKQAKPRLGLIMETELWPNLIGQAKRLNIPVLLINARLSDGAFNQYAKVAFLFKPILNQFTAVLSQSEADAERFIALGASEAKVMVLGNMKFDVQIQIDETSEKRALKDRWGPSRRVIIAASTHDDEEKQLLSQLVFLQHHIPGVLLLIAPRHPERFQAIFHLSQALGFKTACRSQPGEINVDTEVVVIDSLGELIQFYKLSDYAFVGGSLVPVGGHNVLEPIAVGVPVFCGPFMNNSKAICRTLSQAGAIQRVDDVKALSQAIIAMHQNDSLRQQQIIHASEVLVANRGTVNRCMDYICSMMDKHHPSA